MTLPPASPQFARFNNKAGPGIPWVSFVIGGGLLVFSTWGIWACRRFLVHNPRGWSDANADILAEVLSWFVIFGPFTFLGIVILRSALRRMRTRALSMSTSTLLGPRVLVGQNVQVIPPVVTAGSQRAQPDVSTLGPKPTGPRWQISSPEVQPLDEATSRRLSELGDRTAKVFNVGLGLFLVMGGLAGFVVIWLSERSFDSSFLVFRRLVLPTLVFSGIAVLVGLAILRDTFKKADATWLAPLRVFGAVIMRRAAAEELVRRQKKDELVRRRD